MDNKIVTMDPNEKKKKGKIPVEKIEIPQRPFREDIMADDYFNQGRIKGVLSREPQLVSNTMLLLTVAVRDDHERAVPRGKNKGIVDMKKVYHFPNFTVIGNKAAAYAKYLQKHQVVEIVYKLETRKDPDKNNPGRFVYRDSRLVIELAAGRVLEGEEIPYILE